ncbi:metal ABC transporter ATP-binding protein [Methanobacterium petrolearium]|uniref:metal ABC transporter ATP-binding protein n=1 Tax=Methanobacterium petrolearium TaxID=710190 RepID=UPI001AEAF647|nr:ABC transporter ATP-binding protein [Methanobacterium petrolearium]MBP1945380.1 zinc transport system ATP-binding protein [Methanobacterium petrolearium]BDZ71569.1 zinc ABC transporter ATP-binding protein [Methanobacterium petrolearium]
MENAVEIEEVSVTFHEQPVLEDINLSIKINDFLAIIGPNGGGKSTLLKTILGLIKVDHGNITVFGNQPGNPDNPIGYLPQHVSFDPDFPINVFDTVLSGRYHGLLKNYSDDDRKKVTKALREVGMLDKKDRQISRLSGGQMQRVFIARAIVREPKLLLLDEPMASIDPEMQNSFYNLLSRLRDKMAIVLVSHDVGAVSSHVDNIACLNQKLFYHGSAENAAGPLEKMYRCPIDLLSHGIPHRVLKKH